MTLYNIKKWKTLSCYSCQMIIFLKIEKIVNFLHTPIIYFQFGSRPSCPSYTFLNCLQTNKNQNKTLDRRSLSSSVNEEHSENWCELQDSVNINTSNAPSRSLVLGPCPVKRWKIACLFKYRCQTYIEIIFLIYETIQRMPNNHENTLTI